MVSQILSLDSTLKSFFSQMTETLGFVGYLSIVAAVEVFFVLLFLVKSCFSYEARLKRILDKCNAWLFANKNLNEKNIKAFNQLVKKGPKRFAYYWQQFVLNREGGPANYMTVENIIEKPLRTSSWSNNIKNLGILTIVWSAIALLLGLASQSAQVLTFQSITVALVLPCVTGLIGVISIIIIKGYRAVNLDDIYHLYHIFARFVTNACDELPPYIDFNLLFSPKEIEKGNVQIREYYEEMARKAKEEFEEAKHNEQSNIDFNFRGVGIDGALLLERAMKESENYISTKNNTLSQIAQVEAQKEALRRNFEDVQMDLQRKLQASKENITKLIEQQATTTNRFEVGRLRERQDKEVKKQEALQSDYDQEESRYLASKDELDKEIERLSNIMVETLDKAEKGMTAEYQTFFKKVLKSAYMVADNKVKSEKKALLEEKNTTEQELINVQTQIKRLLDENVTLRARLDELLGQKEQTEDGQSNEGRYDAEGNFIYADGAYHDTKGLFHDVDGKVYDMNGVLVVENENKDSDEINEEDIINEQIDNFGSYIGSEELFAETPADQPEEVSDNDEKVDQQENLASEGEIEKQSSETEEKASENLQESEESKPSLENEQPLKESQAEQNVPEENGEQEQKPQPNTDLQEADKAQQKAEETEPTDKDTQSTQEEVGTADEPEDDDLDDDDESMDEAKPKRRKPRAKSKKRKGIKAEEFNADSPKKRGRPRKNAKPEDEVEAINSLISEQEEKLDEMRSYLENQFDWSDIEETELKDTRQEMINEIESLKQQANSLRSSENSSEELSAVNEKIEALLNQISSLDKKN